MILDVSSVPVQFIVGCVTQCLCRPITCGLLNPLMDCLCVSVCVALIKVAVKAGQCAECVNPRKCLFKFKSRRPAARFKPATMERSGLSVPSMI